MQNYLVGANETPTGFPGMAHAQEHMAFRGCADVTADQIAAIFAQLGGFNNADTQQTITQYFATVPAADLEVALRVDAACMRDVIDSDAERKREKGALEQEGARDLSAPARRARGRFARRRCLHARRHRLRCRVETGKGRDRTGGRT